MSASLTLYEHSIGIIADACASIVDDRMENTTSPLLTHCPVTRRGPPCALIRRATDSIAADAWTRRVRRVSSQTKFGVLRRDGFTCRYSGERLLHLSVLYILSFALDSFCKAERPHLFGLQRLTDGGRPAHYDLFPAVDHVVSVARRGSDYVENLVPDSWAVNLVKSDRKIDDFENLRLRPRLSHAPSSDGLSNWAVFMLERFPSRFEIGRNVMHSRDLLASRLSMSA